MQSVQRGSTILVIDHDAGTLAKLVECLQTTEYACVACLDAESARARLHDIRPDLIIAELNMGGRHATAVCAALLKEHRLDFVPLMLLSATQVPDVVRSADAGGVYYLRKPPAATVLVELVTSTLLARKLAPRTASWGKGRTSGKPTLMLANSAAAFPLPAAPEFAPPAVASIA